MRTDEASAALLRFGNFELDLKNGELRRGGVLVKIPPQPMALLALLAENAGELVARDEIQRRIWGGQTFVDADRNLNVCMAQIRSALGDDADAPRFIRTVPKRGYMFLPPVERVAPPSPVIAEPRRLPWIAPAVALGLVAIVAGIFVWRRPAPEPSRVTIAVLPFESSSEDASLSDGLTEELISHLGSVQTERLGVIARGSVMRYKSSRPPLRDVARDLNVRYLVEGTIRRSGQRVRVTARLVKAADQAVDWTESYEDDAANLFRIEEESAAHITAAVLGRLFPRGVLKTGIFHVTDRAAYDAYRTARTLENQGSLSRSLDFFEEAVRLDPRYADAYAGLADACVAMARSGAPPEEMFPRAAKAAASALELNSSSAEAHNALANVRFWFDWNWAEAEQHFRIALRMNPSYAEAHHDFAWFLVAMGRTEEALTSLRRAIELDPFSVRVNMDAGWLLLEAHRFDDAIRQARRALDLSPGLQEAEACIERAQSYKGNRAPGPAGAADPYSLALHYALSGDKVRAMRELDHAYESRSVMMPLVKVDPAFTSLRGEPAFEALVAKVGTP
ncbi:MAG: winged helix-turn-helix domain-containing protein [Acidobacteriia bacterium]|nr:winged helix-turn-helix domain-containing protein [Terriglobia bacterium]